MSGGGRGHTLLSVKIEGAKTLGKYMQEKVLIKHLKVNKQLKNLSYMF